MIWKGLIAFGVLFHLVNNVGPNMKIILTGATGFIGQNISPYLENRGHYIHPLSLHGSWKNKFPLGCDAVIHLAGKAHDTNNNSSHEVYFQVNSRLTKDVFDNFLRSSARDFIYFSSVKAVADSVEGILTEQVPPSPRTPYGLSKLRAEQYLFSHKVSNEKRVIVLRPCMVHGPGNKGNLKLLYKFVKSGLPWPLAAFDSLRSFLSVDNLCFIVDKMLNKPEVPGAIYNIADDDPISINQLIHIIAEASGRKVHFWKLPTDFIRVVAKAGDAFHLPFNTERLKKLTESYVVSNEKIKSALALNSLPVSSRESLIKSILSFENRILK